MNAKMTALGMVALLSMAVSFPAAAEGGKNAYNNPNGDPADDTFEAPYVNAGDGRVMVFCAEGETLVLTPVDTGSAEATCVPAGGSQ